MLESGLLIHSRPPVIDCEKSTQVVEMLRTPDGATLDAIMEATDWQRHTVRGFIAGTAQKKLGLKIESFKNDAGQRTYRVGRARDARPARGPAPYPTAAARERRRDPFGLHPSSGAAPRSYQ